MQDFRKLKVWQSAHSVTLSVYQVTRPFPKEELFGLTSQMRRSSSSIAANIAEGCGSGGPAEFARSLQIAMRSASELEYHLLLARDLALLDTPDYEPLSRAVMDIKKMLASLISRVKSVRARPLLTTDNC